MSIPVCLQSLLNRYRHRRSSEVAQKARVQGTTRPQQWSVIEGGGGSFGPLDLVRRSSAWCDLGAIGAPKLEGYDA
nr:unnamed protein product [Digitaria exilis]